MIREFCDAVYDFIGNEEYFSAHSLKLDDFESDLYELGFEDWFYANLLISDNRFSSCLAWGCLILYKGKTDMTIKSFEMKLIKNMDALIHMI